MIGITKCSFLALNVERDELRKDIEQLCMQQAGPSYLGIATRMHFQRFVLFLLWIQLFFCIEINFLLC